MGVVSAEKVVTAGEVASTEGSLENVVSTEGSLENVVF